MVQTNRQPREESLPVTDLTLPLPLALWWKDNVSPLLAKFVAGVRQLPEVKAFTNR